jgi:hypothetical protein
MRTYTSDPRWINAKFDSITKTGEKIRRGDLVLYFPADKSIMTGEAAKQAWRDFEAAAMDEHFMSGRMY